MPRPTTDHPRSEHAGCRVTPTELERIQRRARAAGHAGVSAFVRARCLTDPPERRAKVTAEAAPAALAAPVSDPAAAELCELIRRAGVNLNQIARHLNEGRLHLPGIEQELRATLSEVRFVVRRARAG